MRSNSSVAIVPMLTAVGPQYSDPATRRSVYIYILYDELHNYIFASVFRPFQLKFKTFFIRTAHNYCN